MQDDSYDNTSSPSQGQEGSGSGDDDKNKTSRGSWLGCSAGDSLKIPTKTHDGALSWSPSDHQMEAPT